MAILAALLLAALSAAAQEEHEQHAAHLAALERLEERAEAASGGNRARRYAELSRDWVEQANRYFYAGDTARGHEAVQQAVEAAEKAGEAARTSRKRMKQTEIAIRQVARRLDDIGRTLAFDDRPKVENAVESMEAVRRNILTAMFAPPEDRS